MNIKKLLENAVIPTKGSEGAAGYDLYATDSYTLKPGERRLFKTGISMAIPSHMYGRIAPRSGLAYKSGIDVMAGVIDSDYRGDIGIILVNLGHEDFVVKSGNRIAQFIFESLAYVDYFTEVNDLDDTVRGDGGYESTGK